MKTWIGLIIRFRVLVIAACLLLTVFLASQCRHLQIIINSDNFIPQSNHYIVVQNEIERIFGNKYSVVIGITANKGTIYQPEILAKVQRITARLMSAPGVVKTNVISLAARKAKSIEGNAEGMVVRPLMESVPRTPSEMAAFRRNVASNPVYENLLVSPDGNTTQIVAEFRDLPTGNRDIEAGVQSAVAPDRDASVDITVAGLPIWLAALETYSARMAIFLPLAILIVGFIHWEAFRTLQALFLPLLTAILSVIWAVSFLAISGRGLDVFNAQTPILILAIAAGHAVQILKRYYEEFTKLKDADPTANPKDLNKQAVVNALSKVGPVMVAACTVAALGFLSLTVFEIRAVRTFGILSAVGVFSALFLELTFIPALRATLRPPGEREYRREREISIWDRLVSSLYAWVTKRRAAVYLFAAIALVTLSLGGSQIKIDNAFRSVFSGAIPAKVDDDKLDQRMAGTNTFYLLIDTGAADGIKNPKVLDAMEKTQAHLTRDPTVGKTVSIVDFIKRMNQAMNADDKKFYSIPTDRNLVAQYLLLYSTSGEPGDFDTYVDNDYRKATIQVFFRSDDTILLDKTAHDAQSFADSTFPPGVTVRVGGGSIVNLALNDEMVRTKLLNILMIMGCVFLISAMIFRSILAGILVLVPLVATIFVNFGIMGFLGIPLNIPTSLVAPMAIGIGADYAIYMCFRLREELRSHHTESDAVRIAFMSAGKAAVFVSTAVAGGFGVLLLSFGFYIHIWMGLLIGLAMLVSSFSTLTLFASLLLSLRPNFIFEKPNPTIGVTP